MCLCTDEAGVRVGVELELPNLVADVSRELNEIVFDGYVSASCDIFPPAA